MRRRGAWGFAAPAKEGGGAAWAWSKEIQNYYFNHPHDKTQPKGSEIIDLF